ncbi:MAG: type II CRISPR-associated endonuclease Cas1 [Candidatus Nealsonbacteria bacterium]|nr:type II CRISPR-associated endonuclease Cas1 [Candidatus Nealsonbacteria bacterium]
MIKRTVEISREPAHLSVRNDQLVLKRNGDAVGQIPCEDVGVVLVDQPQTTYTHSALTRLADCGATVVLCGRDHLPVALVLPLADHSEVVWRINEQLAVKRPLKKQLWRQIVRAKIRGQAKNLAEGTAARKRLVQLAREVKSGDPKNAEAQAARIYWAQWLPGEEFRRDRDLPGVNAMLNYGYAVARAAVARALVAAGLLPAIGLHHCNRSNAFCLADDLVEPLRPMVDHRVRDMRQQGLEELTQQTKAELLRLLTDRVQVGDETGPLMVNLHRMVASLVKCFQGKTKRLEILKPVSEPDCENAKREN